METKNKSYSPFPFAFNQGTIESRLRLYTAKSTYSSTSKEKNQLVTRCSTLEISRCKCNLKFMFPIRRRNGQQKIGIYCVKY